MSSLYERIGGEPAIDATVELFYRKVLADERVNHFFDEISTPSLIAHQKAFLTHAFGGPNGYTGRSIGAAHRHMAEDLGLTDAHFDAVMENLGATLQELGIPDELIGEAAAIAESTRGAVLNRN